MQINDTALKLIGKNCHQLLTLDIKGCKVSHLLPSQIITSLSPSSPFSLSPPSLHLYLNSSHSPSLLHIQNVTDRGIQALSDGCSELRSLSVSNCETLTDISLKKIAANCHNLRFVYPLPPTFPPSLPPSLTHSLLHSLPPSLTHSFTHSLTSTFSEFWRLRAAHTSVTLDSRRLQRYVAHMIIT